MHPAPYYQFDFKTAWLHVAKPAFNVLAQNLRDLYLRVADEAEGLTQKKNLEMPWPDSDLQGAFEEIDSEVLASAAMSIYFYGHWFWIGENPHPGAYWKFTSYADQVLRARCGLPQQRTKSPRGISYQIHDGMLRICVNTRNTWAHAEFGLATPTTLEKARAMFPEGCPLPQAPHSRDETVFRLFEKAQLDLPKALYPKEGMIAEFQKVTDTYQENPVNDLTYIQWLKAYGGKLMGAFESPNPSRWTHADLPRLRSLRVDWAAGIPPLKRLQSDLDTLDAELEAEEAPE